MVNRPLLNSLENTAALLDFLESLLQLQAEVLPMVQADARSRQSDEIVINGVIPCKSSMLIPLARDAAYMCGALIFCLRKLNGLMGMLVSLACHPFYSLPSPLLFGNATFPLSLSLPAEAVRPEAIKDLNDRYCCAYLPTAEFVSACQKLPSVQPFIDDLQNLPMVCFCFFLVVGVSPLKQMVSCFRFGKGRCFLPVLLMRTFSRSVPTMATTTDSCPAGNSTSHL